MVVVVVVVVVDVVDTKVVVVDVFDVEVVVGACSNSFMQRGALYPTDHPQLEVNYCQIDKILFKTHITQ